MYSFVLSFGLLATTMAMAAETPANTEAAASKPDSNACTWFSSIDDWKELDDRNLIVWASRKEFYHVELSIPLFDLSTAPSIAFVDHNHDGRLCGFGMDEIVIPHSSVFGSSTIIGMTRLDDDGLARLAEKYHVKLGNRKQADKKEPKTQSNDAAAKPAEASSQ